MDTHGSQILLAGALAAVVTRGSGIGARACGSDEGRSSTTTAVACSSGVRRVGGETGETGEAGEASSASAPASGATGGVFELHGEAREGDFVAPIAVPGGLGADEFVVGDARR